jgi:6-phosphofructokinase
LIPEENPIDFDRVLDHLDERALGAGRKGYALILAGEGIVPSLFENVGGSSSLEVKLESRFKMTNVSRRVFVNQPKHYVRAVPANDQDQLYCRQLADCAVDSAIAGFTGFSISRWLDSYVLVPFERTAGRKKTFPLDGITWKQVTDLTGQPVFKR